MSKLPKIAPAYTDEAEKAYTAVERFARHPEALVNHDNVSGVLKGQFAITGGKKTLKSGNLAHAIATLALEQPNGATTVWHVTETGRKRVVLL